MNSLSKVDYEQTNMIQMRKGMIMKAGFVVNMMNSEQKLVMDQ